MKRASHRCLVLLEDLMAYVKVEAGQLPLDINPFDPQALLADVRETVEPEAQAKDLTFRLLGFDALPPVLHGDKTFIQRVVLALLWNAIVFSDHGEISLLSSWDAATSVWMMKISDEGSGIAPEHVPHIFEPLWRGANGSQSPTSGCGIGLAMAQALAQLMNGQLELEKTGPGGSVFCLRLPLSTEAPATITES
jgi:signal transduction histidine kinase